MKVQDLFSLKGKVVIITGGYGHLGTAMSHAFEEAGAIVYVGARNKEKFDAKFAGEENISTADIEQQFLHYACEEADALVIVDGGGYLGQAITIELCKAVLVNLTNYRKFRIYFTEQPMVFRELDKGQEGSLLFADGKKMKFLGPDELCEALQQNGLKITQEKYDELYPHHWKLYEIYHQYPGLFQIGIDELYEPEKIGELPTIPGTGNGRQIF